MGDQATLSLKLRAPLRSSRIQVVTKCHLWLRPYPYHAAMEMKRLIVTIEMIETTTISITYSQQGTTSDEKINPRFTHFVKRPAGRRRGLQRRYGRRAFYHTIRHHGSPG